MMLVELSQGEIHLLKTAVMHLYFSSLKNISKEDLIDLNNRLTEIQHMFVYDPGKVSKYEWR